MNNFSKQVTDFWNEEMNGDLWYEDDSFTLMINEDLEEDGQIMLLENADKQRVNAVITSAIMKRIGLTVNDSLSESVFLQLLKDAGISLHGADYIYYYQEENKKKLLETASIETIRLLNASDAEAFEYFVSSASEQDLDDAYVELDHWVVFGSFEDGKLVSAASMYPWGDDVKIADLGVLTLPDYRGKGHARNLVHTICKYILQQDYEPQYRCQIDNHASVALAAASGLTLYGKWDLIASDSII
ncbi:GNAT family N-acetyltransferase [Elizabethkingia ursingii]|uniref:Acetyltransferase n=1 Tax=Elizabethkingia ursingii TaxID=1756150 RepID=A0AAJ3TQ49_9FLAO|nr:GNAT family N-acetyltransferase [Elizabethkingia ursingii]AQX07734.1 acetyltransferase [Elizabethkingia ursingii]OPB79418.1 acetyltransferase [Elizabethkingia ursingii]